MDGIEGNYPRSGFSELLDSTGRGLTLKLIILDLCGGTGSWSKPYLDAGYQVINVTLPKYDVRTYEPPPNVYGILSAPPCDQFSFCRTNGKIPRDLRGAMDIVFGCLKIIWECQYRIKSDTQKIAPLKFWALENPNGMLKYFLGKPVYEFNPYDFGDNYKKRTFLWGCFNEPIKHPKLIFGDSPLRQPKFDMLETKKIHSEFYGILDRKTRRAITPSNFAQAFFEANQ